MTRKKFGKRAKVDEIVNHKYSAWLPYSETNKYIKLDKLLIERYYYNVRTRRYYKAELVIPVNCANFTYLYFKEFNEFKKNDILFVFENIQPNVKEFFYGNKWSTFNYMNNE